MTLLLVLACGLSPSEPSSPGPGPAVVATTPQIPSSLFDGKGQLVAYKGRFAGNPRLDEAQVALIAPEELVLVRNEVFARYGRVFKTDAIREHFEAQDWYAPNPDYSDTLLTENDKANADLIKSFEGSGADPLKRGEFAGNPPLMFVDAKTVTIAWGEGMYEHLNVTRRWAPRGDYVVTWDGSDGFDPSSSECQEAILWKLDHATGQVTQVADLPTG